MAERPLSPGRKRSRRPSRQQRTPPHGEPRRRRASSLLPLAPGLLGTLRSATDQTLVAYPNSGEAWNAAAKRWEGVPEGSDLAEACVTWQDAGATVIGGCCRVGPAAVRRVRKRLLGEE